MNSGAKKNGNEEQKQKMPATLFQLLVYLIRNFFKTLPQRILFALITGAVVLVIHTYLMVVKNEGFRMDNNSTLLKYILMLNDDSGNVRGSRLFSVTLFWMLVSAVFWGIIAQIRGLGIKVFLAKQLDNYAKLFSDIFEKPGTIQLSIFLASICSGLIIGILLANPYASILLSVFIFMAVSARGTSLMLLVAYLAWSDFQRLFRFNPKRPFYIDIVSMAVRGVSVGLLLFSFTPFVKNGNILQYIILLAFAGLLLLNMTRKTKPNLASFLFFVLGTSLLLAAKVFADDGGWKEAGGTFGSWSKSDGAKEAVNKGVNPLLAALSMALGFVPVVGDVKDGQEALTGIDLVTGDKLAWWERGVTVGAAFLPIVSGKLLRTGVKTGLEALGFAAKHGDDVVDVVKHSDEIVDVVKHSDDAVDVVKHSDDAVDVVKHSDDIVDVVKHSDDVVDAAKTGSKADDAVHVVNQADDAVKGVGKTKVIDVELKYKEGWTAAQKAEADAKVKALTEATTVKTAPNRSGTSASSRYKKANGPDSVPKGKDVDHTIDLQLGGADDIVNMGPLDNSVNRSLGKQIQIQTKEYPIGTEFGEFKIR